MSVGREDFFIETMVEEKCDRQFLQMLNNLDKSASHFFDWGEKYLLVGDDALKAADEGKLSCDF